ncbi:F-box/LRR-repeat protein 13-like [Vicia villosa]|uniref:F-box/LRR-repeat protein 13-like n=1 Tax=Vicia villosa TaxID=3911 RepID=UPI00273A9A66|nr:F-box/LRR-repeat protein 13-like [Vicia villosa]
MSDFIQEDMIRDKTKRRRHYEDGNKQEGEDRLSDLPDCIVLHILSFLNTKHVVQTCVLSTRWKHLWKHIPSIILHPLRFTTNNHFVAFVSNILSIRHNSTALHVLDLICPADIEPQLVKRILNYVFSHNTHLQQLRIGVCGDIPFVLRCVSSCHALTSLWLSLYSNDNDGSNTRPLFPKSLNMPSLTTLNLTNFVFSGGDPFLGFTKLNSLVILSCFVKDVQILNISNDSLVNLAIRHSQLAIVPILNISSESLVDLVMHNNAFDIAKIHLSTPSLCSFTFTSSRVPKIYGSGLSSVKQVIIEPCVLSNWVKYPLHLFNWLLDFVNVKSLTVTSSTLQILSLLPNLLEVKLPSLFNLKSLEVELIPIHFGSLEYLMEKAMLKKATAKSLKEAAKLRKEFKGLKPPPIHDGMVDFLLQNSPSAQVNITTKYDDCFNLKQVAESVKGTENTCYRSQFAVPATPTSASAAAPASAAPPGLYLCHAENMATKVDSSESTLWPDTYSFLVLYLSLYFHASLIRYQIFHPNRYNTAV